MSISTGDVVRVELLGDFDSTEDLAFIYQLKYKTGPSLLDEEVITDMVSIADALAAILKGFSTLLTVWRRIRVRNAITHTLIGEADLSAPVAGDASGDPGAPGVAGVVTFKTSTPRVMLRKFTGPLAEGHLSTTGRVGTAGLAALVDLADYLMDDITVGTNVWVYGHQSAVAGGFVVPSSALASNIPAYQRRRRQGVGG